MNVNPEPPKLVVNEKRYGRKSKPDSSYSEDLYSADDESLAESRTESQTSMKLTNGVSEKHEEETHQKVSNSNCFLVVSIFLSLLIRNHQTKK